MAVDPKVCPIPADARASQQMPQAPSGISLIGGTQMMLGIRVNKTWNATTKQFEWMSRPGITQGNNGEKRFIFGPSKLL